MIRSALLFAMVLPAANPAFAAVSALMPLPMKVEAAPGRLLIDASFTAAASPDARLARALVRFVNRISRQTGIPMGMMPAVEDARPTLRVECAAAGADYPALGEDESYTLDISADGALVKAPTVAGALHGLETFAQSIVAGPDGFQAPAMHIEDRPRFPWRGLMMDVSRHWIPLEIVLRNLDAMAAVKLNVLHWHLSDDQGFRVESKRFPRLQELGSDGHYYTQDEIRRVVAYARDRGIRVVPEFDIPGHTTSWFPGYPELASAPGPYSIGRTWGVYDPAMDPTREETYQFLDSFLGEMVALFPDPYFHIGGDEVNGRQWNQSAAIQGFASEHKLADAKALQVYFNQRVQKLVAKYGKIMIGWDEVLQPDLPVESVIHVWRGQAALAEAATKGHRAILSWGYYLDHLRPASYHYGIDPLAGAAAQLTPEQAALVLGGEACMWGEYVSAETIDSRIWPRAAAIAERLWSARDVTDVNSMYDRMEAVSRTLEWTGVEHRANYLPMLDRLAAGQSSGPLRVLADACEGLGLGPRARAQKYTSLVPLNRLADAARPESESIRALEQAAARWVSNAPSRQQDERRLRQQFTRWAENDADFQALAEGNALLVELKPVSQDLAALGSMGLRLLDYLAGSQPAPAGWVGAQIQELARMQKPKAEVTLAAVRPVKALLDELARRAK